jgi:competence protein ComEC
MMHHHVLKELRKKRWLLLGLLAIATIAIWIPILAAESNKNLTVSFLDVGQGDAIFIQTPSGRQILVDGGPGNTVLRELDKVMPFFDRSIDIVVATHQDADHIGGLIEVFKRYDIEIVVRPDIVQGTQVTESLFATPGYQEAQEMLARRGQTIDFGDGAYLTVLFPDRDVSGLESNAASVVVQVGLGEYSFMLTGDSPKAIEEYLVRLDGEQLKSDVLKAGHHGSRTSSSELFVGFVNPTYGILSRGCENSYGHPHQEVLTILTQFEVEILDTCENGRVTFETDGSSLYVKSSQ